MTETKASYKTGRRPKVPRISEHAEQATFISEVRSRYGHRRDFTPRLLFAVPNGAWFGGKKPWAMYAKLKAEGMQKGVSDILYLQPRGGYAYLVVEMKAQDKRDKAGAVTQEQQAFLQAVIAVGATGSVCYGAEEAFRIFSWYMTLPPMKNVDLSV